MKSIAKLAQQVEDLALYLRTIKADVRRASKELNVGFSQRARRPLESSLRWRRYRSATDLQLIAEACLHDLRKAQAIRLAPFSPGDQVIATLRLKGFPETEIRCGIWDIEPRPRGLFVYEVIRITKVGLLSKRCNIEPFMADRFLLRLSDAPLERDSAATLSWRRQVCEKFVHQTVNIGSLDDFKIEEAGLLGHRSLKRRT